MDDKIKMVDGDIQVSTETLATFLDVSRRTLTNWVSDGCPKLSRGWWSLRDVLKWREEQGRGISGELTMDDGVDLKQKKLRVEIELKEIQRDFTRLKKRIADGEFLEKDAVTAELKRFMVIFKRSALGIPRLISAQAGLYLEPDIARKLEKQLTSTIKDVLEQMTYDGTYQKRR